MAESKGAEIARAYVLVIPSTQGAQKTLTEELVPQAEKASEEAGHKSGSAFCAKMGKAIAAGAAAVATAAAGLVASVVSAAKDVAALGDSIDKQSQKVGLSTEAYQKWDYVMQISGTSMQACTTGLKTLTNKFDDAISGSESAAATFAQLGLSMSTIKGMSREDLFAAVVKGLQGVTNETKKAALANDLFGKSGQDLLPLFNMTDEEVQALMADTEALGMIMSEQAVKDAAAFTDSMTRLKGTLQGLKTSIVAEFLPGLTQITTGFAEMVGGVDGGSKKVAAGVADMVRRLVAMAPSIMEMVADLFPELATVILENLPLLLDATLSTLESIIDFLTADDSIETFIDAVISIMLALVNAVPRIFSALAPAIPKIVNDTVDAFIEHLPDFIQGAIDIVTALVEATPEIIVELLNNIPNIVDKVVAAFKDPENQQKMLEAGKALGQALWNGIKSMLGGVFSLLGKLGDKLGYSSDIAAAFGVDPKLLAVSNTTNTSETVSIGTVNLSTSSSNYVAMAKQARAMVGA